MKKSTRIKAALVIILTLVLTLVVLQPALAAGTRVNFPLMALNGTDLVADANTKYIAEIEQDPVSKMITATVKIANETTGPTARPLIIAGVGLQISFDSRISPYRYNPITDGNDHDYNITRLYYNTGPTDNIAEFSKYCYAPISTFNTFGSTTVQNNAANRYIGGKVSMIQENDTISIAPGSSVTIAYFYFMPSNGLDLLDLNMFSFKWSTYPERLIRHTTWIANGSRFLVSNESFPTSVATYVLNPGSFKMHFKQPTPVNLSADDDARVIVGYNNATMEWSYTAAGPYSSGAPTVLDTAHTIYVRYPGTAYSGNDAEYGNYKMYLPSEPVAINFLDVDVSCANDVSVTKTAMNITPGNDDRTHVGDTLQYTIIAKNDGDPRSVWADAVLTDTLPAGVTFAGNVKLNGTVLPVGDYTFSGGVLRVPLGNIVGKTQVTVTFEVTVNANTYGQTIQNSVVVDGTDGVNGDDLSKGATDGNGQTVVGRSAAPTIDPITEGDATVTGTGVTGATVRVTLPGSSTPIDVTVTGGVWSVTPTQALVVGQVVTAVQIQPNLDPSASVSATVAARPDAVKEMKKTSRNETTRTDGTWRVNDYIEYTITMKNAGPANSLWTNARIDDTLPSEVTFVVGSVTIDGQPAGNAATFSNGVLTVNLGNIASQVTKTVIFRAQINDTAYGKTFKNSFSSDGITVDEDDPPPPVLNRSQTPTIDVVFENVRFVTGTGVPGASISATLDGYATPVQATVGQDGTWRVDVPSNLNLMVGDTVKANQTEPGLDVSLDEIVTVQARTDVVPIVTKTSENLTHTDGTTHVGDTLRYTVTVRNDGNALTTWVGATMTDVLPAGITFVPYTVLIGNQSAFYAYNTQNRTLTVQLGNIVGQTQLVVTFDATVNLDAHGLTIKNSATVTGKNNTSTGDDVTETGAEDGDGRTVVGKSATPTIDDITAGDTTISGTGVPGATIVVTLPDNTTVSGTVDASGNWTVNVPAGKEPNYGDTFKAVQTEPGKDPSDEATATVGNRPPAIEVRAKGSINTANRTDGSWRVGDTIEYTLTAKNNGPAGSLWADVVIEDTLPSEVTFVTGSVTIDGQPAGAAATFSNGVLTVTLGNIASQVTKTVVFRAVINDTAYGKTIVNTALIDGEEVKDDDPDKPPVTDRSPRPTIDDVFESDRTVTGTGVAGASISATLDGLVTPVIATVGQDGTWLVNVPSNLTLMKDDSVKAIQTVTGYDASEVVEVLVKERTGVVPSVIKTSENISRSDGTAHVGDTLKYTVAVKNNGNNRTTWVGAMMTDVIPVGLTLNTNSIQIDGQGTALYNYNPTTRTLTVQLGNIVGQSAGRVVTFEAAINAEAYGQNIKNSVSVAGKENTDNGPDIIENVDEDGDGFDVFDKSANPIVNDVSREDTAVTGEGVPGATIEVTFPGNVKGTGTVDANGDWSVDLPPGTTLNTGDEIRVIQIEPGKDPSDEVIVIVRDKNSRAVHGYVWPMAELIPGFGLGDDFLRAHDIVVELRPTFLTPADAALSTTAKMIVGGLNGKGGVGEFTIQNVPFGTYVLYIKRPGYLARAMMVTVAATSPDLIELVPMDPNDPNDVDDGIFNLWAGDCYEDYRIDNSDVLVIIEALNLSAGWGQTTYSPHLDLNADGRCDNEDILMILQGGHWDAAPMDYAGSNGVDFMQ